MKARRVLVTFTKEVEVVVEDDVEVDEGRLDPTWVEQLDGGWPELVDWEWLGSWKEVVV